MHSNRTKNWTRRRVLKILAGVGVGNLAFQRALTAAIQSSSEAVTAEMIRQAEWVADIELPDSEREEVAKSVDRIRSAARQLRSIPVDADTVPALVFRPDFFYEVADRAEEPGQSPQLKSPEQVHVSWSQNPELKRMQFSDEDLAFASIRDQASLLASKQISSRELTELYLARLQRFNPLLNCLVSLLEEHAIESAAASDARRQAGQSLGILDGIPWVAKDLIAVPPWKTTWGAEPFKDQVRESTASVALRLQAAGAVLLAKVTLGALAWGDQWFGGMTRNPWNPEQGSSGSSAGSAAAVAAGLASFALGSETLGSIVSPTRRCRTSGLRPTFGRVSRAGCMPLAWSFDKIGPIARQVDDLAFVFAALLGKDQRDPSVVERPFEWSDHNSQPSGQLSELRVGLTTGRLNRAETKALDVLRAHGATIVDIQLDSQLPTGAMSFILGTEASCVFEDAFRQDPQADYGMWPSTFRESPFTPAMQYIRANRLRSPLIIETQRTLSTVDVVLGGDDLLLTNLTGHPSLVLACGEDSARDIALPGVVKLTAAAYQESKLLRVGASLQALLPPSPARPPLDEWLRKQREE